MKKWIIKNTKADLEKLSKSLKKDKLICKIVSNRGLVTDREIESFLNSGTADLHSPWKMKDMERAVDIVLAGIAEKSHIRVVGDYDQDGISSTVILCRGLAKLNAEVDYDIPERTVDGYGINKRLVMKAYEENVDIIITCDNGIAATEAIDCAREHGITVVITDHHEVPFARGEDEEKEELLPNANAILNPKRKDCSYPFDGICGAGVAFKFIQAIYERVGLADKEFEELYEFLALATVCDVMDLVEENRVFVKEGLLRINCTDNTGLKALISQTKLNQKKIGTYHLGFILGPCINASGRLETAKTAVELFMTKDEAEALEKAKRLYDLNEERKKLTQDGTESLIQKIEESGISKDKIMMVIDERIQESIAGIIAGRLREKYTKPAIVITASKEEGVLKASGRSIEEYDMFEELSKHKELFLKFGGHHMAAGFSIPKGNLEDLRHRLNRDASLTEDDFIPKLYLDAHIPIDKIDIALPESLEILEPFGKGNSRPLFGDKHIKVGKLDILGKNYKVLKFRMHKGGQKNIEAIYFGDIEYMQRYIEDKFGEAEFRKALSGQQNGIELDLVYYPSINEYNGRRTLQIVIQDYR